MTKPINDCPLTKFQQFQKSVFTPPKGSLLAWGIAKMEFCENEERVGIAYISGRIIKRIIAAVMPLFALLDAICFLGKAIFKAITLRTDEARADIMSCGKCLGIFFASIIATPPAICFPLKVYRSEKAWDKVMDKQVFQRIKGEYETRMANVDANDGKGLEVLRQVILEKCGTLIADDQIKNALQEILQNLNLPQEDQDNYKQSVLVSNYMALFAHISVVIWKKNLVLSPEAHQDFVNLAEKLCDLHNDEIRLKLTDILLNSLEGKAESFKRWQSFSNGDAGTQPHEQKTTGNSKNGKLAEYAYLPLFAASQLGLEISFVEKISDICSRAFKEKFRNIELTTFLCTLYSTSVDHTIKEEIITQIHDNQSKADTIYTKANLARNSMKIFTTLLTTNDAKLIESCLQIGKEEGNSDAVLKALFNEIFDIELEADELKVLLEGLRAPWAWLRFHTRLKELSGSERSKALEASRKCLKWFVKGTYHQKRHNEDNNAHLEAIFDKFPDLRQSWVKSPVRKVAELIPGADDVSKEFDVLDTQDPSDILLIGVEAHQCMNLFGRLYRLKGLVGFLMDGKTHVMVVKNARGEIRAEGELQLMWDSQNKRPVLFLEEICTAASFGTPEAKNVRLALLAYAKERAHQLKLDLVGHYEDIGNSFSYIYDNPLALPRTNYNGNVSSLGTSSPIEYVNCYLDILEGPYTLKGTNIIEKAFEAQRPDPKADESQTSSSTDLEASDLTATSEKQAAEAWLSKLFDQKGVVLDRMPFLQAFLATDATEREQQIAKLVETKKSIKSLKAKKMKDAMALFRFQELCLQLFNETQLKKQKSIFTNIQNSIAKEEVPFSSAELIEDCQTLAAHIDQNKPTGEDIRLWLQQTWIQQNHIDMSQLEILNKALAATDVPTIALSLEELKAARKVVQASLSKNSKEEQEEALLIDWQEYCMQLITEIDPLKQIKILESMLALQQNEPFCGLFTEELQGRLNCFANVS